MDLKSLNAIILSGGQSKRMGVNKAFLPFKDSTFIESIIQMLKSHVKEVIISGDPKVYGHLGCKVVEDRYENCGPLAGILSGLQASKSDWNIIISVDAPFVDIQVFKYLSQIVNNQQVVIASTKEKKMPLIGLYHKSCTPNIEQALQNKNFKVMQALKALKTEVKMMDVEQQVLVNNINTPDDYKANLLSVSINFFGQLSEITTHSQLNYTVPKNSTIEDLKVLLFNQFPLLKGKVYKIALNNVFASEQEILIEQSKIDLLPAFAGG